MLPVVGDRARILGAFECRVWILVARAELSNGVFLEDRCCRPAGGGAEPVEQHLPPILGAIRPGLVFRFGDALELVDQVLRIDVAPVDERQGGEIPDAAELLDRVVRLAIDAARGDVEDPLDPVGEWPAKRAERGMPAIGLVAVGRLMAGI